ncbi:hypothetical protein PIB30_050363 [Stylosanthes scabra]|uniref:Uncharacterized protein n=1 Tax=Stylosanthes scabra TaxID=79078 RepID=A0ABU6ZGB5_9FABA|nr:hypothetical protein [Stylosanthes scabra]
MMNYLQHLAPCSIEEEDVLASWMGMMNITFADVFDLISYDSQSLLLQCILAQPSKVLLLLSFGIPVILFIFIIKIAKASQDNEVAEHAEKTNNLGLAPEMLSLVAFNCKEPFLSKPVRNQNQEPMCKVKKLFDSEPIYIIKLATLHPSGATLSKTLQFESFPKEKRKLLQQNSSDGMKIKNRKQ